MCNCASPSLSRGALLGEFSGRVVEIIAPGKYINALLLFSLSWCNVKATFKCVQRTKICITTSVCTSPHAIGKSVWRWWWWYKIKPQPETMLKHISRSSYTMHYAPGFSAYVIRIITNKSTNWNQRTSLYREMEWNTESRTKTEKTSVRSLVRPRPHTRPAQSVYNSVEQKGQHGGNDRDRIQRDNRGSCYNLNTRKRREEKNHRRRSWKTTKKNNTHREREKNLARNEATNMN